VADLTQGQIAVRMGPETPQPIVLVVHQPVTRKPVGDLFNYVGAKASDAWHVRRDAAARELDAVSGCDVRLLVKPTVLHAAEEPCSIRQVA